MSVRGGEHPRFVAAHHVGEPVDDGLRGVDLSVTARVGIGLLPGGEVRRGERVLPADVVPVVHGQGERDDAGTMGETRQHRVRWRAGRATLAREEFDHARRFAGDGGARDERETGRQGESG